MKPGDIVKIHDNLGEKEAGIGIYLGVGSRGTERINDPKLYEFLWKGETVTFDRHYWSFEILSDNETIEQHEENENGRKSSHQRN